MGTCRSRSKSYRGYTLWSGVTESGKPVSVAVNAGSDSNLLQSPWGSASHQGESIGFANYLETSHKPRYCFGYGLSYGEFVYSDMKIRSLK